MQKHFLTIISGLIVMSLPLVSTPDVAASDTSNVVTIAIHDFKFEPATVTIHSGDTVEWKNEDSAPHTATVDADKPAFDSGVINSGGTWRYNAKEKGTYAYICTIHPNMKGTLIVQ